MTSSSCFCLFSCADERGEHLAVLIQLCVKFVWLGSLFLAVFLTPPKVLHR